MSIAVIKKLLEVRLNTVGGIFPTAFENVPFTPVVGTAWQSVHILPGQTENPTFDSLKREVGLMQVTLNFPQKAGAAEALARAELIRAGFVRGLSMVEGNVSVRILRSPYVGPAANDGVWYQVPLSVPYTADVS